MEDREREKTDENNRADSIPRETDAYDLTWKWKSAQSGNSFTMRFSIKKKDIQGMDEFWDHTQSYSSIEEVYRSLLKEQGNALSSMVESYKALATKEGLNYMETLEMVVSSIQSIPYTWVLQGIDDCGKVNPSILTNLISPADYCDVRSTPPGCCDGVPYGVYAPVRFAYRKTGDCDTRSLFAYSILKSMGFDIAVMLSDSQVHSVLGVRITGIQGDGKTGSGDEAGEYYLWELTAFGPHLGMNIDGNDWYIGLK